MQTRLGCFGWQTRSRYRAPYITPAGELAEDDCGHIAGAARHPGHLSCTARLVIRIQLLTEKPDTVRRLMKCNKHR